MYVPACWGQSLLQVPGWKTDSLVNELLLFSENFLASDFGGGVHLKLLWTCQNETLWEKKVSNKPLAHFLALSRAEGLQGEAAAACPGVCLTGQWSTPGPPLAS